MADPGGAPGGGVPPPVLRAWDEAEAGLFPLVMARPDLYEQALTLIGELLSALREDCPDIPALLEAHARGADLAAGLEGPALRQVGPRALAAAACAARYRELAAAAAAAGRLAALRRARERGQAWAVVEESGDEARAPYSPYHRVEAEVATGRALIVSIEPDETLSRAVRRLDEGRVDQATGELTAGDPLGAYLDQEEFAAALEHARGRLAG